MKSNNTFKKEVPIASHMSSHIQLQSGQKVINFCANNYLGLADNQQIIDETKRVLDERGFGMSSVRFICGTTDYHLKLERDLADFYEQQDCILFSSCFDANESIFESFMTEEDAIISDKLNHASIINGIRLCKAKRFLYTNNDMADLEQKLQQSEKSRFKVIVTDGVFSMDGQIAKLNKICELAEKYSAIVMVDECHGTGVLGEKGRGAVEMENVLDKVDIISSTLGKALGGANGGFITGRQEIIDFLRQRARPYLFSNTLPQPIVAGYLKGLEILKNDTSKLLQLKNNVQQFREGIAKMGFTVLGHSKSAIVPVLLKDEKLTQQYALKLREHGIFVIGFSFPVVGKGLARIRLQLSAAHSEKDIEQCLSAFNQVGKELKVI